MSILNYIDLCKDSIPPEHVITPYLDEIKNDAERSANLTRQLLAFARKQAISPQILDLNDTVEGILKLLRRLIGEDIDLAWLPGHDLWKIKVDPSQVDQILANLAVNARDAIQNVGKISIETQNIYIDESYSGIHAEAIPGEYVMLVISDDGSGIEKDVLNHIFEPFFTTKGLSEGTGLGLATVYGIVKQNDGFINVYSEVGEGTTFRIYFPRSVGETSISTVEEKKKERPKGTETVLLVEDEKSLRVTCHIFLKDLGYKVLPAKDPHEALELAKNHPDGINLLVTDVVMPGMSGKDLADKLRQTQPELKCLYISGYTADIVGSKGVLDQDVNFLEKPFSRDKLAVQVRKVLDT
jgi:CheY-like chemotaxis protein